MELDEKGIITAIKGSDQFKSFLLAHNVSVGTNFTVNYSPSFSQLVNLTVSNKMISLRKKEFQEIEWVKIG